MKCRRSPIGLEGVPRPFDERSSTRCVHDLQDVETERPGFSRVSVDPGRSGTVQPGALAGIHRRRRSAARAESTGLHLDERDGVAVTRDDVDLVSTVTPVPVENSDASSFQPGRRESLSLPAGRIQLGFRA
jgi:hypothetical protein